MMSSSLVLSRGGAGYSNPNASVVSVGDQHHQSYYADFDESSRRPSKSYKGSSGKGSGKGQSSGGQRDVLRPKSRTASSSSVALHRHHPLDRIAVGALLLVSWVSLCN